MSNTNSNVESRVDADGPELAAAQAASDAVASLLDSLLAKAYNAAGLRERAEKIVEAFGFGECTFKAELVYDRDGVLSFQFFVLRPGMPPKPIFDCVPIRKLDS